MPECDVNVLPGGFPNKYRHIVVLVRDQVYAVEVWPLMTLKSMFVSFDA